MNKEKAVAIFVITFKDATSLHPSFFPGIFFRFRPFEALKKSFPFFCQDLATNPYLQHMLENYSNLMYNSLASQRRPEAQLPLQNGGASRPSGTRMSGGGGGTGGQDKGGPPPSRGGPSWC